MFQILDQTNLATRGLERGDMGIIIRRSLTYDLVSTHVADALGSPTAMKCHLAPVDSPGLTNSRISAGDAGVILRGSGGFQVFIVNDAEPQKIDDVRLYQSLALMNAALALREGKIMRRLLKAADGAGLARHENAPGLTKRQRQQRIALRGLQIMLLDDSLFEELCDITTDEGLSALPFFSASRH